MLQAIVQKLNAAAPELENGQTCPRSLGDIDIPMGHGLFRRGAMPFTLWKAQRAFDAYQAMSQREQTAVRDWLTSLGGQAILDLKIPRVKRLNVRVAFDGPR